MQIDKITIQSIEEAYSSLIAVIILLAQDARAATEIATRVSPTELDAVALSGIEKRAAAILAKYRPAGRLQ